MGKQKYEREASELFAHIELLAAPSLTRPLAAGATMPRAVIMPSPAGELRKMKKFRFQLLHRWLTNHIEPCRVADIGGGKGLLAYLLQESGWPSTVIDPISQSLPTKYKDLRTNKQTRIMVEERVPRIEREFANEMARHFDLLVAMHAHGCNLQMVDAAREHGCDLILLPCCVIHEPLLPPPGVNWIQWVVEYVIDKGFAVQPFRLNFKGQSIGIYARRQSEAVASF